MIDSNATARSSLAVSPNRSDGGDKTSRLAKTLNNTVSKSSIDLYEGKLYYITVNLHFPLVLQCLGRTQDILVFALTCHHCILDLPLPF